MERCCARRAASGGFGYDPLFLDPLLGQTGAELPLEEKNRISHRGKALAILVERLSTARHSLKPDRKGAKTQETDWRADRPCRGSGPPMAPSRHESLFFATPRLAPLR